ncbi:hypothetical protein F511_10079 [Dorcoceras hygrometricum]|uniref:Uncharacterized protein n=1 Tax=Dorcoceras hygrometricum TaxID=472368 RepID=A0A2Z7A4Q6_9LAMI|nr:hypothetical protein F511_10079 [Dorcoceras hygrometricum]
METFQSRFAPLEGENLQKDCNKGAGGDAVQTNSNSGCEEQLLAAAVASREIALVQMGENLEDEELGEVPKGPLQRSLSAGNLKLKGLAINPRVVTRNHTRTQGTSSSQSFK